MLFHAASFAAVHPISAVCRLAEVDAIVARHRLDPCDDGRLQLTDVKQDRRLVVPIPPALLFVLVTRLERLVPSGPQNAVDACHLTCAPIAMH
jgi:hypothetical protein